MSFFSATNANARAPILASLLLFFSWSTWGQDAVVHIAGSGSAVGTMKRLAEAYSNIEPGARIEVMRPIGSPGGIRALAEGRIDIAIANRRPDPSELVTKPMQWALYGCTPFVVAANRDANVTAVSVLQLVAMYSANPRYPDGKRARPILRISDSTENRLLASISPAVGQAVEAANKRPGMLNADTDLIAADLIERTPGGFGPSSLAVIESERRAMVPLSIDGKVPTVAALEAGAYPWRKDMYAISAAHTSPLARRFLAFVLSAEGKAVLHATGHSVRCP